MPSAAVSGAVDTASSCASSTTLPVLRTHLVSSSSSLLDATLVDLASRDVVYALITDPSTNTTMITRPNAERVAYVQWATSSSSLTQPTILFEGDTSPISANETLFSSSVLGHSRKFRSAGYAECFKWKKVTGGWQCFTSTRSLVASLQLSSRSGSSLQIYRHHSRPFSSSSSSSSGSRNTSSEESLQDTLVITSLLLTTPPYGSGSPPKRFSSSVPTTPTSTPIKKHASMPGLRSKRSSSGLASPTSSFTSFSSASSTKATSSRSSRLSTYAPPSLSTVSYASANTLALPSPPPSPFVPTSPISPTLNAAPRRAFEIERETPPPSASIIPRSRHHSTSYYYVQPLPDSEGYEEAYYPPLVVIPDSPETGSWNLEAKIRALETGGKLRDTIPLAV